MVSETRNQNSTGRDRSSTDFQAIDETDSDHELDVGKAETKAVSAFRIVLIILLTAATIAISLTAYFLAERGQQQNFEFAFESFASKVCFGG